MLPRSLDSRTRARRNWSPLASSARSSSQWRSKWSSRASLLRPVTIRTSRSPARVASSTTYWIAGLSTTGSISLGVALVAGRKRVPIPAAGITALVTAPLVGTYEVGCWIEVMAPTLVGERRCAGLATLRSMDSPLANRLRYVVFGAGAIGAVVGGRLSQAGCDVTLIARGAHLAALQTDGLSIESPTCTDRKLLTNLGNAIEAVCGPHERQGPLGDLLQAEGEAVLSAAGLEAASAKEDRDRLADLLHRGEIAGQTRPGGSSWQSLRRGTGDIETDYLNGEIVLLGRIYGIPTPANELLQRLARELATTRHAPGAVPAAVILERLEEAGHTLISL